MVNNAEEKIIFINPPSYKELLNSNGYLPLGICSISSFLEAQGIKNRVYNLDYLPKKWKRRLDLNKFTSYQYEYWLNKADNPIWNMLRETVSRLRPKIAGITMTTPQFNSGIIISRIIKETAPDCILVGGGIHATSRPGEVLTEGKFDFVVRGEGEKAILDLVKCIYSGKNFYDIPGLCYKSNGELIVNKPYDYIENLDMLPYPKRAIYSLEGEEYIDRSGFLHGQRGCAYSCRYCVRNIVEGDKPRLRSAESMVSEMEFLQDNYGISFFEINDAVFTYNRQRVKKICNLIIRKNMHIEWDCQTRADLLDENMLSLMKKSGCTKIYIGVESGDQDILNRMDKRTKIDCIERAFRMINKTGILSCAGFMLGYPGETAVSLNKTKNILERINPDILAVFFFQPYPGSEVFDYLESNKMIKSRNWLYYNFNHVGNFIHDELDKEYIYGFSKFLYGYYLGSILSKKLLNPFYLIKYYNFHKRKHGRTVVFFLLRVLIKHCCFNLLFFIKNIDIYRK